MKTIKSILIISTIVLTTCLTACHTIQGAGEDLQAGGQAISKAAAETSKKMN